MQRRRDFLRTSALTAGALALGPSFWRTALAQEPTHPGAGPYGALGPPNADGLALPEGFTGRVVARAGLPVGPSGYQWPPFPDGSATFARPDGGWVLVSNSEVPGGLGGASSISFDPTGRITGARRILGATSSNCAGGATPWGTWLSCEEVDDPGGWVWECDPSGARPAVRQPAMGRFKHEAAAVDPVGRCVYLTEDLVDGGLYRYTPGTWPDLAAGTLEIAAPGGGSTIRWVPVPDPSSASAPARQQVPGRLVFRRGEGIFYDSGVVYVATTDDERIHAYDTSTGRIEVLYDGKASPDAPLHGVDNVTVHQPSGDLYVCEDGDNMEICLITGEREVAPFCRLTGPAAAGLQPPLASEMTGVTFDPSGTRLYFNSQRAFGLGATYEVSGPFRALDPRQPPRPASFAPGAGTAVRLRRS